jgi:regulator of sirC expression with transglutaminase-like and TPR domain
MNLKKYEAARNDLEEALKLNPSDEIALLIKKQIGNIN